MLWCMNHYRLFFFAALALWGIEGENRFIMASDHLPAAQSGPLLNWLFGDMNSFFASVEQDARPELRGRPVGIVPMMSGTTCCIAASYEAKAFGVKTGTIVADAKRMCPGLVLVEARHELYVAYHHR